MKIKINDIKPNPENPRIISTESKNALEKSITNFGLVLPLILTKDYYLISGHQRLKILESKGIQELELYDIGDIYLAFSNKEIKLNKDTTPLLNVALNKISGDWDYELLDKQLLQFSEDNYNIDLTGFGDEFTFEEDNFFEDEIKHLNEKQVAETNFVNIDDDDEINLKPVLFSFGEFKFQVPRSTFNAWKKKLDIQTGSNNIKIKQILTSRLDL